MRRLVIVIASVAVAARALAQAGNDWAVYHGDSAGSHYSSLQQIDRGNVRRLQPAWTFRTGDAARNSQIQCNPLVVDGVLFGTSPQLKLFALDAATGVERWRFDPFARGDMSGGRGLNRGLVLWREGTEQRLLFTAGNFLHAVDPRTGKLIADFGDGGRVDLYNDLGRDVRGMFMVGTSPGAVYRDVFIVSTRVGEGPGPAAPGHMRAYDVRSGKLRWIFHTIPHPGEAGHETWPADAWKTAGAANNWQGLVIDQESGTAFVPTGSASFDFWGGNRGGDNLYANCLLALDALTGERKWHFQFVHHDLWDRDPPAPPVLCEVTRDGKRIKAVVQLTKTGHIWVFDRATGESFFPWREVPVPQTALAGEIPAKTQPVPLAPAPFARQVFSAEEATDRSPAARAHVLKRLSELEPHTAFTPPTTRGMVMLPGFDGGAEWGGGAVDPGGVLYVNSNEMAWVHTMIPAARDVSKGLAVYDQLCIGCHAPDRSGNAAANIPTLVGLANRAKRADVDAVIRNGRGIMPAFGFIEASQREALVDFLLDRSTDEAATPSAQRKVEPTGGAAASGIPFVSTGYHRFLDPDGYPALRPPWGTLNAIDLNTGEYRWKRALGEFPELTAQGVPPTGTENYGGPLVTAGGVVFIAATKDEKFRAFDSASGELLWETTLPAGGYASPATYSVNGRQYVVIACGGGKMGTKPGDAYVAFALPRE